MSQSSDLKVRLIGDHLNGLKIDFLVGGGIAAIESPRLIRELRRYGAEVRVILSSSAGEFVRPLVFEWASAQGVVIDLSGQAEHISQADAVVVSPATLNFLGKLANGLADCPASTSAQSVFGRVPFFIQPSMHESLLDSPGYQSHVATLKNIPKVHFLQPKMEEEKAKSADPIDLVAEISHVMNLNARSVLVMAGPTRAYIDDVRYLSNLSSGRLGLLLGKDFYRRGFDVDLILGPTELELPRYLSVHRIETRNQMRQKAKELECLKSFAVRAFAAAILDFEPSETLSGKLNSNKETWTIELKSTPKMIDELIDPSAINIGFKLESGVNEETLLEQVKDLQTRTACQWIVGNRLQDVSRDQHRTLFYTPGEKVKEFHTKEALTSFVAQKATQSLLNHP